MDIRFTCQTCGHSYDRSDRSDRTAIDPCPRCCATKGVLNFKGSIPEDTLKRFHEAWRQQIEKEVSGRWKTIGVDSPAGLASDRNIILRRVGENGQPVDQVPTMRVRYDEAKRQIAVTCACEATYIIPWPLANRAFEYICESCGHGFLFESTTDVSETDF